jgi:hypothetical protein
MLEEIICSAWPPEATLELVDETEEEAKLSSWGAHACFLDMHCRQYGAPNRLYLFTPWGSLIVGERTQLWLPWKTEGLRGRSNFTRWWSPIAWHPPRH